MLQEVPAILSGRERRRVMPSEFRVDDWQRYRMEWSKPHEVLEPLEDEVAVIDDALEAILSAGVLPHVRYDTDKMLAHREAVKEHFDIPWTAITPRMQRLLYAVNAIHQPRVMVAVGIFCGNTFVSNAGAALGPGKCYDAGRLVGIELREEEAARAARNAARIDREGKAEIVAADGVQWLREFEGTVDLLYLDADGGAGRGKSIYMDLLEAAMPSLGPGSLVLAHNSVNSADSLAEYLRHVRNTGNFAASINMVVDDQGLEVSRL